MRPLLPRLPSAVPLLLLPLLLPRRATSHGFLSSPRARNLVAYDDRTYSYPPDPTSPLPEDCPQCLNRGGSLARCGVLRPSSGRRRTERRTERRNEQVEEDEPMVQGRWTDGDYGGGGGGSGGGWNPGGERNYDFPTNSLGAPLPPNPQAAYYRGQIIDVEVTLTAHHGGHFEFKACPSNVAAARSAGSAGYTASEAPTERREAPTQACFDAHPLTFVRDELYGAPLDPDFPARAYVAPPTVPNKLHSTRSQFGNAMVFRYKLRLPSNLTGGDEGGNEGSSSDSTGSSENSILLQWHYVASNAACAHEGYATYPWPERWGRPVGAGAAGLPICDLSEDGDGIPEQFWNCAEATIAEGTAPPSIAPPATPPDATSAEAPEGGGAELGEEGRPQGHLQGGLQQSEDPGAVPFSATPASIERSHAKTIIGYYASWQWYDRQKLAEPKNLDFAKVTRVNFAFFQTNVRGDIWGTDSWADPNVLFGPYDWNPPEGSRERCSWDSPTARNCNTHYHEEGLIHLAHAAGAEVYPSLGGWSLSDPFPAMAADEDARSNFAEECARLVEEYDFDGVDLDWEYPGYEGERAPPPLPANTLTCPTPPTFNSCGRAKIIRADHSGTPDDTENYTLLLRDVRRKLDELSERTGRTYGLTSALPCGTSNIANIDIPAVVQYLTEFNLMTYDFFGSWSPTAGANAPLYDQEWGDDDVRGFSVDGCVRNWIEGGAPPEAINLGLPFYGRSFAGARGLNEPHGGNDKTTWFWDDGSPQYFNIVEKLPSLVSVRHEPTKTQYAYKNSTLGGLVSYDDAQAICDKTQYCLNNDLNGFIIWELSGDVMADLSTPLLDAVNAKLTEPSLDCESLAYNASASEVSDLLDQQHPLANTVLNQPSPPPSSPPPTDALFCPTDFTGPMQYGGCAGYYHCVYGSPTYPVIPCPVGTMFDEKSMLCLQTESVACSETIQWDPQQLVQMKQRLVLLKQPLLQDPALS
ncbi:hypothetical protein ACHAWF_013592 [Thalassiosira exigua]